MKSTLDAGELVHLRTHADVSLETTRRSALGVAFNAHKAC